MSVNAYVKFLVWEESSLFEELQLDAPHVFFKKMPDVKLPSGMYKQFLCEVVGVSDHNPVCEKSIKHQFLRNTGGVVLKILGFPTNDVSVSWMFYHNCSQEMIIVGPVIGGKIRSFRDLLVQRKNIDNLEKLKVILDEYVVGDHLQMFLLHQEYSSRFMTLQKEDMEKINRLIESDVVSLDFAGPHYSELLENLEAMFSKQLEKSVTGWNFKR